MKGMKIKMKENEENLYKNTEKAIRIFGTEKDKEKLKKCKEIKKEDEEER